MELLPAEVADLDILSLTDSANPEPGINKMNICDSCILVIVTLVFIVMVLLTRHVFKLVEYGDKRLMFMLVFLDLTLLCKRFFKY